MKAVLPELLLLFSVSVLIMAVFLFDMNRTEIVMVPKHVTLRKDLYKTIEVDTVTIDGMTVLQIRYMKK